MFELMRDHQLNIMLVLCGSCAILIFLLVMTRFLSSSRKRILVMMELMALLLLWFDRMAYVYAGDVSNAGYVMVRVSNFLVFFLTSGIVCGFDLYLWDYLVHEGKVKTLPKRLAVVSYIAVIGMILSIVSAFTGLYYYFDANNMYHRGRGFLIAYIIPVVGPLIIFTVIQQYRKIFSKLIYISLLLYIFVPLACGILQIFTYGLSIVNMAMVAVSVCLYLFTYIDINNDVERAHEIEITNMQGENKRMKKLFDQTAMALVSAMEKKDTYYKGHSVRIADYSMRIAELAGKTPEECEKVYYAGLLHDVGIIGIPDNIIEDPAYDDETVREEMKKKPLIGNEILSCVTEYPYLGTAAHYSHEKYDGSGYPEGLKGEEIPETARIVAIADAYVSMTSEKRYREPKPDFLVREALVKGAGEKYDPLFTELLLKIIDAERNEEVVEDNDNIETEVSCHAYRENVTRGIALDDKVKKITFDCSSLEDDASGFSAPSVIIFDSYDKRIHTNEKAIEAYAYLEYGELWFDSHSITSSARRIVEKELENNDGGGRKSDADIYEISACRYEDHLKLIMKGPSYKKEVIVALPGGSKSAYLALTGENCELKNITVTHTDETVGADSIPRIAEEILYTDRLESDIKNKQIDRTRSDSTEGVEISDRLRLNFHTMSLPGADLVWHCPYILIYTSDDGSVHGENYREYSMIKLYGENDGDNDYATNSIYVRKTDEFRGWEEWKKKNKYGLECEVKIKKKDNRIILKTTNLGIELENTTTIKDDPGKIYVALTGDQIALTDIRVK